MNSFELSKIFGPIFATIIFIMVMNEVGHAIFNDEPQNPGYVIEVAEADSGDHGEEVVEVDGALALIATGDIAKGESITKKCAACHTFDQGGADKVGPHLWGSFNRALGSVDGFKYSGAMQEKAAQGLVWDEANLSAFLTKPKDFIKGTSMGFAGIKKDQDRADLIAYLKSLQ